MALTTRNVVLIAMLSVVLTVGKMMLASIPNVEVVTLFFILFTLVFGWKRAILISVVFSTVEILIWGFGLWTFGYYLFWPVYVIITALLKERINSNLGWAIVSGLFGLFFGLLFALYSAPIMHLNIFMYWMSGLTFDLVHMIGNFVIMLALYNPLRRVLEEIKVKVDQI